MTTTHTFQGLTADGKPSSRVLNPPGGSSSNIFGANDEPQQRVPIRNNPDNVNRGNSDVFGPGHNAAVSQQKSRAPRSGYNPITGESYEQAKTKQEVPAHINNAASKTDVVSAHISEPSETCSSVTVVEEDKLQPEIEDRAQAPAPTPVAADQKKQTGVFAGSEDPKELRSTRVSQPPGGRSTKLW